MEKIIAGPGCQGALDLDAPPEDNLKAIAERLDRDVDDLVVMVLDRPRHEELIARIRKAGARIRLISDGDLSAGIAAAVRGAGVHAVTGIGGAPEGTSAPPPMCAWTGQMLARSVVVNQEVPSGALRRWASAIRARSIGPRIRAPGREKSLFSPRLLRHAGKSAARRPILRRRSSYTLPGDDLSPPNTLLLRDTVHLTGKPDRRGVRLF